MTQNLAWKLIEHYKQVIVLIRESKDISDARRILELNKVEGGICYCSWQMFGVSLLDGKWVTSFGSRLYWYTRPIQCDTNFNIIDALQFRINRLKTFKDV